MAGAHLHLYNVQFKDGGTYQCEAVNSKGKDYHSARVSVEGKKCVAQSCQPCFLYISYSEYRFGELQYVGYLMLSSLCRVTSAAL